MISLSSMPRSAGLESSLWSEADFEWASAELPQSLGAPQAAQDRLIDQPLGLATVSTCVVTCCREAQFRPQLNADRHR